MGIFDKLKKDNEPAPKSFDDIAGRYEYVRSMM